jgi:alpha-beta hydrolase superfamily lysophospholipase
MTRRQPKRSEDILIDRLNRKIPFCSWLPEETRYQLIMIHGFSEHMRSYYPTAEQLREQGIAVHLMDLPGHGLADGPRGDIGHFEEYFDNIDLFFRSYPKFRPDQKTFLLGHSLGGLIAALYCLERSPNIAGLILSSPLVGLPPLQTMTATICARLLARRNPGMLVPKPFKPSVLTRNRDKWRCYHSDPLRLHTISPRLFLFMQQRTRQLRRQAEQLAIPLLIFYSRQDQVISPAAIERLFQAAGSRDKTAVPFVSAMHELFQEVEQPQIVVKMLDWMDERV